MSKKIFTLLLVIFLFLAIAQIVMAVETNTQRSKPTVDIPCLQNAIEKRDTAMIAAWDKFSATAKSALEARKTALKNALGLTDKKERRAAWQKAWSDWKTAAKNARLTFWKEKKAAWKQFYLDRKTCRGTSEDTSAEGFDVNL